MPITTCKPVNIEAATLDDELMLLELLDDALELVEDMLLELELMVELETLEEDELLESELELTLFTELDESDAVVPPLLQAEMDMAAPTHVSNTPNFR